MRDTCDDTIPDDPLGAFCRHNHVAVNGKPGGPLDGLTMGVKDLYDIAGHRTGFGNPTWLATHEPASETAPAVQKLLDAGADMVGKTICEELCYSLNGENVHYGTPINVNAPGRLAGGSSSGSAAAVAGRLVDFALGSDTGGSVRLPASYCGLYGIRTTHGRISTKGVAPLAPSFDTVGWFARDGALLNKIGPVLLDGFKPQPLPGKLLILQDAFDLVEADVKEALAPAVRQLEQLIGPAQPVRLAQTSLDQLMQDMRILQGAEVWQTHGQWISDCQPDIGPGIAERLAWTATITDEQIAPAEKRRNIWLAEINALLPAGSAMILPTAPGAAPPCGRPASELEAHRLQLVKLLAPASMAAVAQINMPLAKIDNCPLGLGVMAAAGRDESLLALAAKITDTVADG